jgi:hypothetical protein
MTPTGRFIGLGDERQDFVPRVEKGFQGRDGEAARSHENEFH